MVVSANLGRDPVQSFQETLGYLRVEFGYGTVNEVAEIYRLVAVNCLQRQITRVLILVGDDDPAGERALRDAATTMVLADVPSGFRLALVSADPRVAYTYRNAQRDLTAAGVNTRMFETEDEAVHWLQGPSGAALESVAD